jgi:predicted esterase
MRFRWDEHALLLFHGLGDSDDNFVKFGAKLQLPQTATLAVRAPLPLLDMGFTWFDVITSTGHVCLESPDAVASLCRTSSSFLAVIHRLHQRYSYALRNIFLVGYAQGGTMALSVLQLIGHVTLGGVVSISGAPPPPLPAIVHNGTPVLFTLGQRDVSFASKSRSWEQFEKQLRDASAHSDASRDGGQDDCSMFVVADKGEAMVQGGDETRVLMQFFSRHLRMRSLQLCVWRALALARLRCCGCCRVTRAAGTHRPTLSVWTQALRLL